MEAERREIETAEPLQQLPLFRLANDVFGIFEPGNRGRIE